MDSRVQRAAGPQGCQGIVRGLKDIKALRASGFSVLGLGFRLKEGHYGGHCCSCRNHTDQKARAREDEGGFPGFRSHVCFVARLPKTQNPKPWAHKRGPLSAPYRLKGGKGQYAEASGRRRMGSGFRV